MNTSLNNYLINLTNQTSFTDVAKKEIIAKIPTISDRQKLELKVVLLETLLSDAAKEVFSSLTDEKASSTTVDDYQSLSSQILLRASAKEEKAVSETDSEDILNRLKQSVQNTQTATKPG